MANEYTSIQVTKKFLEFLKVKGRKGESYEEIIRRLMKK